MPHYEFFCHGKKVIFESLVPSRLRRGRGFVPALRQQGSGAVLVRLLRHHLQEERVTTPRKEAHMRFDQFSFGTIRIDGSTNARKDRPSSSVTLSATPRFQ